jgi:hypothetical protein
VHALQLIILLAAKFVLISPFFMLKTLALQKSIMNYEYRVNGQNGMSKGTVKKWCRILKKKKGQANKCSSWRAK